MKEGFHYEHDTQLEKGGSSADSSRDADRQLNRTGYGARTRQQPS